MGLKEDIAAAVNNQRFGSPEEVTKKFSEPVPFAPIPAVGGGFGSGGETPRESAARALGEAEPALLATAGTVGGLTGTPLGPAGVIAGAGLAVAGTKAGIQAIKGIIDPRTLPSGAEQVKNVLAEAGFEATLSAAIPAVGQLARFSRTAKQRVLLGVDKASIATAERAAKLGIGLGAIDVGKTQLPKFTNIVFGRFPFLGKPFRVAAARKGEEVLKSRDRLFIRLGPSMNMAGLGVRLNAAVGTQFKLFRRNINKLYTDAFRTAREQGAQIPTSNMREIAVTQRQLLVERAGEDLGKKGPVAKMLNKIDELPETISMDRFDGLMEQLDNAMATAKKKDKFGRTSLNEIKRVSEFDLREVSNPVVAEKIKKADEVFSRTMRELFETPTAQKLGRVERGRFKAGEFKRAGTIAPDETFRVAFNLKSPQAMRDLRLLVGKDRFKLSVRSHLDNAFDKALREGAEDFIQGQGSAFNVKTFKELSGVANPKSAEFAAITEALKGTGLSASKLSDFADTINLAIKNAPPDVNSFIARRVTLGGARGIKTAIFPLATGAAGAPFGFGATTLIAGLGLIAVIRSAGKAFTNPILVKNAKIVLSETNTLRRRAALEVLLRGTGLKDQFTDDLKQLDQLISSERKGNAPKQ